MALLRALHNEAPTRGIVLQVAHLHHGLRGEEADSDLIFVRELADRLALPFHEHRVDTNAERKAGESLEEAARRLRYSWFRKLLCGGDLDAIATAHTRDDQAETVLAKFLRGAWTEGLSGIYPVVEFTPGRILRPLLGATRKDVENYLNALEQPWREDSTNAHLAFTRNRIRHELLPQLETWNPQIRAHLAQTAELAREEEAWLATETSRAAAQLLLPGRPVRGGGRAAAEDVALDLQRLSNLPFALQRRVLRFCSAKLGAAPDFSATELLRNLALSGRAGQKCELAGGLRAERTHRELRLSIQPSHAAAQESQPGVEVAIPGLTHATGFALEVDVLVDPVQLPGQHPPAMLRPWRPGDRVRLQYSSGERKVKEVLERMKVTGAERARWPVLVWQGRILWMQGVSVEPQPGITIQVQLHP